MPNEPAKGPQVVDSDPKAPLNVLKPNASDRDIKKKTNAAKFQISEQPISKFNANDSSDDIVGSDSDPTKTLVGAISIENQQPENAQYSI